MGAAVTTINGPSAAPHTFVGRRDTPPARERCSIIVATANKCVPNTVYDVCVVPYVSIVPYINTRATGLDQGQAARAPPK